ncbi:MAG: DNA polymerase III subunit alpha, partial [Planctomycetales bacterium]
ITGKEDVITQWAMNDVENAGLLKMDFLGLRNLTILSKAVELIERNRGEKIDPYKFPLDDKAAYDLLCRGETKGVFQLESGGIRDLLQRLKPDAFHDIIAVAALYRPGPLEGGMVDDYIEVKHGRKKPVYKHPVMKEILEETHGVMVYQEQVMRILNRLGGIELSNAYKCIKAISKKKLEIIAKFKSQFIEGSVEQGLPAKEADDLFGLIEKFAGYGFNKSHSTAYALIAYMTAYLKAHYQSEFMAALLSSDISGRNLKKKDALVEHIEDCRRMNIDLHPPDVNSCYADFAVRGEKILFGLSAIKSCGESAARAIASERDANGPYTSVFDLCERIDSSQVNRAALETLIKAGGFDSIHPVRRQAHDALDRAVQSGAAVQADRRAGQKSLFGDLEEDEEEVVAQSLPNVSEWEEREKLTFEKEVLGFYLTSHPLDEHKGMLETYCTHTTEQAAALPNRADVLVGGMLAAIRLAHTKRAVESGAPTKYGMFDLEDLQGILRCIAWPEQFAEFGEMIVGDAILGVRGRIDKRPGSEEANLIVDELIPLKELEERYTKRVAVRVYEETHGLEGLEKLYEILRYYPGEYELQLMIQMADGSRALCDCEGLKVALEPEMRSRVEELLGSGNFRLVASRPTPSRNTNGNGHRNGNGRRSYNQN